MLIPAPLHFRFATLAAGFKKSERQDLALCVSDLPAAAAATFTTNRFQAAPVLVGREIVQNGRPVRAVVINAGQANACTGEQGLQNCRETLRLVAHPLGIAPEEILPASTGVIGVQMPMERWRKAAPELVAGLGLARPEDFAKAIMTTDAFPKLAWRTLDLGAKGRVSLLGMAKGAGMICPNMATMLGLVLCDAQVEPRLWQKLLAEAVAHSFNRVTVDGDTSTNDTVYALANGAAKLEPQGADLEALAQALHEVCDDLAGLLVADAEGGTKVIHITVQGAQDTAQAENVARTVGHSPLVKTAFYGRDANWGRIVAAVGRSNAEYDLDAVSVSLNGVTIFRNGGPVPGDKDAILAASLRERRQEIRIDLGQGPGTYTLRAADLTHEYVSINADYTT